MVFALAFNCFDRRLRCCRSGRISSKCEELFNSNKLTRLLVHLNSNFCEGASASITAPLVIKLKHIVIVVVVVLTNCD